MHRWALLFAVFSGLAAIAMAQEIPEQLHGKWVVKRVIPTTTISCWGNRESKRLIGTEIEYTADSFRWQDKTIAHPDVTVATVAAEQFHRENSGGGAVDSQVSFGQLGIRAAAAMQVSLSHPDGNITESTNEIPGDRVLIKSRAVIIFSMCNVYFEALRRSVRDKP